MMRFASLILLAAAPALMAPATAAPSVAKATPSLCRANETPIFSCRLGKKSVAVCGITSASGARSAEYRFGTPGRVEMTYPGAGGGALAFINIPYSGGGEEQISFDRSGYRYLVYSGVYRTSFGADGRHDSAFEAGMFVMRDGKVVTKAKCTDPADATLSGQEARRFGIGEGKAVDHP